MVPADLDNLADVVAGELTGAEVALLSMDSSEPCLLSRQDLVRLPSSRALVMPIEVTQPSSATAYVITREACERLARSTPPMRAPADA